MAVLGHADMNFFQMAVLGHAAMTFFSENKKKIFFSYIRFYNGSSRPPYSRPESNSSVKKSMTAATVDRTGSVYSPLQKDIHFCKYTLYCFRVPSRHDLSMIS